MMASPKSIKSTWPLTNKADWTLSQQIIHLLDVYPVKPGKEVPVHPKTKKLPYFAQWQSQLWVMVHALVPIAIHQSLLAVTHEQGLHPIIVFALYFVTFSWTVVRQVRAAQKLGHEYGFLDGDVHERDGIPDIGVDKVVTSLYKTTGSRIFMATHISYKVSQSPLSVMSDPYWWAMLWLQIGLYGVILDFWFYVYHRAMHDVDFLWKYHRTHHLTKHPNTLLSAFADHEQEFFDMVVIPFMTWGTFHVLGIPLGFYDWWICHQYITFTEVLGHSGLRVYGMPPSTFSWILTFFGAELVIEDHDLHHRKGYRKSHNYGKQTRVWDCLFGTCHERIEATKDNINWDESVYFPIF